MQWRLAGVVMNKASVSVLSLDCVFKSGWGGAEGSCLSAARVGGEKRGGLDGASSILDPERLQSFTVTGEAGTRPGGKNACGGSAIQVSACMPLSGRRRAITFFAHLRPPITVSSPLLLSVSHWAQTIRESGRDPKCLR